ncbi:hypothetical protein VBD025_06750 [Virgibacillus flavescens]|uniref:hypothetical protein n=1 Tax=Virgibacillus flavescens TaxID=1611422 RepID=UPI003D352424
MREAILLLAETVNNIHDKLNNRFGMEMTDDALHFWIIGIIGILSFFVVYGCFKFVEKMKWSTTIQSFIFTFTIMIILVFAIELQQAITNRGSMEFSDAVMGLWGFLAFFAVYCLVLLIASLVMKRFRR